MRSMLSRLEADAVQEDLELARAGAAAHQNPLPLHSLVLLVLLVLDAVDHGDTLEVGPQLRQKRPVGEGERRPDGARRVAALGRGVRRLERAAHGGGDLNAYKLKVFDNSL